MNIVRFAAAAMLLAFANPVPAIAEPVIDYTIAVNQTDGYGQWIVVNGEKPPEIQIGDTLYRRGHSGFVDPDRWYAAGLIWGQIKAIRLKVGHPLYAKLAQAAAVSPPHDDKAARADDLRALKADINALIDRRIEGLR